MSFAASAVPESVSSARSSPALEIVGDAHAPPVLVLGGISADRHVCRHEQNRAPGWWDGVAGSGRALDLARYQLVGADFIDEPAPVTTHDQADAIAASLDQAEIEVLHAVVGASYGGMVALAFAERYPERVGRLVVIGAAHRSHAMASARRLLQRRIVELGVATGRPREALALARGLALTTYRSDAELEERFSEGVTPDLASLDSWLRHQGDSFARRYPVQRYLSLSLSSDLHCVNPARITTATTLVALEADAVVPIAHMRQLAQLLGGPAQLVELPTRHGHDGFLTDTDTLAPILRNALEEPCS